ncbi:hypothetical protein CHY_1334 [Carboxydothermus hydrogenoformans Z-2901]|uniref:Uncharacterized protein n=1 Tax=Carboxydothermus hydrogenoformans (strain ATCC BAA-161 / DSM 6008 / Z-2901) TaxID=246194 RepID=Q3ACG6_CARHZ|nr:hypothetical protein CHY_1334 [Carboxydothermus hydrogenoformans Z-2901]
MPSSLVDLFFKYYWFNFLASFMPTILPVFQVINSLFSPKNYPCHRPFLIVK